MRAKSRYSVTPTRDDKGLWHVVEYRPEGAIVVERWSSRSRARDRAKLLSELAALPRSYKPEFLVEGVWCGNGQRFATHEEANSSGRTRWIGWTLPTDFRVVPSDDEANYRRVDGRDELLANEATVH
jgi:hypothetical protein